MKKKRENYTEVDGVMEQSDIMIDIHMCELLLAVRHCKGKPHYTTTGNDTIRLLLNSLTNEATNMYATLHPVKEELKKIIETTRALIPTSTKIKLIVASKDTIDHHNKNLLKDKCVIVTLPELSLKNFNKGHSYNIKRAKKLGTVNTIYYNCKLEEEELNRFYESVINSRSNINKTFSHNYQTFLIRADLIAKGKALLSKSALEDKVSYTFVVLSKYNSFYYDSGYIGDNYPFTGHHAQYCAMEFMKTLGVHYYNLGAIDIENNSTVNYYKSGFSKEVFDTWEILT